MKKITILSCLIFLALFLGVYFVFLSHKISDKVLNQSILNSISGKTEITLVDKITNQALSNKNVIIQEVIYCKDGADCTLPILFQGTTSNLGKIKVKNTIFDHYFNIEVESYYGNGPFKKQKDSNIYIRKYSDGTIYEFDYKKDNIIILIESKKK